MDGRMDAVYAAKLAKTYLHSVTAWRAAAEGGEELVYEAQPCALSRSAHTSAPTPPNSGYVLPEAAYRYALYTLPAVAFSLGDRVEITDGAGMVYRGRTSDSFRYPSHCVTVVEVREVSHETCPEEAT